MELCSVEHKMYSSVKVVWANRLACFLKFCLFIFVQKFVSGTRLSFLNLNYSPSGIWMCFQLQKKTAGLTLAEQNYFP